ncbi:MAG: TFIIB-type zinc ribbon-containing protein [Eubacteriales bacterium]|nr:TFIIB-type zinc ribbon-containing protein [Eubacteriales bacterium]MDY3332985.1 TFIIB-type zinc ribbon-containing protein [Gallibacter sp.]
MENNNNNFVDNIFNFTDNIGDMQDDFNLAQDTVDDVKVVQTSDDVNGQDKCPMCGATDISLNQNTGKLRCNFCRHEFTPEKIVGMEDVSELKGKVVGAGAQNIVADTEDMLTLKCQSCGAEVVIDTAESAQARCHWCRNTLSINEKIPNGSIPDVVLPFAIKKDEAKEEIEKFVANRKFFAHPTFKKEFTTENIMGVYFPYMLVDINGHADFSGEGEHEVRSYKVGSGDNKETRYDADLYHVERSFDVEITELSIESSADKLDKNNKKKTTNIINSIMPFDTENCVKWNANFLRGFTSEKRDTNVDELDNLVKAQAKDIAKFQANDTLTNYDRGVRWNTSNLSVKGEQWKAAYLPVWLYSYQQKKGNDGILHYIAVNARTKETMGSVPIHKPKLLFITAIIELIGALMMIFIDLGEKSMYEWSFLLPGILFYSAMYLKYRNSNARHTYEKETKTEISNMVVVDEYIRRLTGLRNSTMNGANNTSLEGENTSSLFNGKLPGIDTQMNGLLDDDSMVNKIAQKGLDRIIKK